MLFATTELAARIERSESAMLREAVRAVAELRPERQVLSRPLAGGVATYSGPGSPLNKVSGLGFQGSVDADELAEVERFFAELGAPVQVEVSTLADASVGELLSGRSYRLVGFENVLGRALTEDTVAHHPPAAGITIEEVGDSDFATWLDTAVSGFMTPDADGIPPHESFPREVLEEVVGDMARAPHFHRYLARRQGEPAGAASVRIHGDVAHLSGASTLPAHRRRGVQASLLARRLSDAFGAGCDVAVVTTQPGATSQRNVQRKGFELLYARAVLVLDPPG